MVNSPTQILLIEDNPEDVESIQALLDSRRDGEITLQVFSTVHASLNFLKEHPHINLILLDLGLKGESGLAALNQIYAQYPNLPIIVLHDNPNETLATTVVKAGAQDYLLKGQLENPWFEHVVRCSVERQRLQLNFQHQRECLLNSEMRLHHIIANHTDGILILNQEGIVLFANPAAEKLLGILIKDLVGHVFGFPLVVNQKTEVDLVYPWGAMTVAEVSLVEILWDQNPAYLASLRDITVHKQSKQRLATQCQVAQLLSQANSPQEAIPQLLQIIGENLEWDIGEFWCQTEQKTKTTKKIVRGQSLSRPSWLSQEMENSHQDLIENSSPPPCENLILEEETPEQLITQVAPLMRMAIWSQAALKSLVKISLTIPSQLPDQVWQTEILQWVDFVSHPDYLPQSHSFQLEHYDFQGVVGIPIKVNGQMWGVMTFVYRRQQLHNAELWEMLMTLAYQIGQFIERKQAETALLKQVKHDQIINRLITSIRQSLDLTAILNTTVEEIRQVIPSDRVAIVRLAIDGKGEIIAESVDSQFKAMLRTVLPPQFFPKRKIQRYHRQYVSQPLSPDHFCNLLPLMQKFRVKSELIFPLKQHQQLVSPHITSEQALQSQCWGFLILHHCQEPQQWQSDEILLLERLIPQIGIAIEQGLLYQQLETANQQLLNLANSDGLTRLANRRRFDEYLDNEWRHMAREQQYLSLILADVDYFKGYNDHYGHQAGDDCLKRIARIFSQIVKRPADLAARYGGEEFAVILPNTPLSGAKVLADALRESISALTIPHAHSRVKPWVTLSVGVASTIPRLQHSFSKLIAAADDSLYQAKDAGRDQTVITELDLS